MSGNKDYFANLIAGANVQRSSRYFEKGTYLVEVDNAKMFMNRKRQPRAAVECTVLETSNNNLPRSSSVSWIVSLDSDAGPSTIKSWIFSMFGSPEDQITSAAVSDIFVGEEESRVSSTNGFKAIVTAYEKPTRSGGVFTKCEWKRYNEGDALPDFAELRSASASASIPAMQAMNADDLGDDAIPF